MLSLCRKILKIDKFPQEGFNFFPVSHIKKTLEK